MSHPARSRSSKPRVEEGTEDGRRIAIIPAWIVLDRTVSRRLTGAAWHLLAVLAVHADPEGRCRPSTRLIAKLGVAGGRWQRAMKLLLDLGIVVVVRQGGGHLASEYLVRQDRDTSASMGGSASGTSSASVGGSARPPSASMDGSAKPTRRLRSASVDGSAGAGSVAPNDGPALPSVTVSASTDGSTTREHGNTYIGRAQIPVLQSPSAVAPTQGKRRRRARSTEPTPPPALPTPLDTDEFRQSLANWMTHKSEARQPLTATAAGALVTKLARMGHDRAIAAIEHSIASNWKTVFEPRAESAGGRGGSSSAGPATIAEWEERDPTLGGIVSEPSEAQLAAIFNAAGGGS